MKYSPKFSESDLKQWQEQCYIQELQAISQDFQETTLRHAMTKLLKIQKEKRKSLKTRESRKRTHANRNILIFFHRNNDRRRNRIVSGGEGKKLSP